MKTLNDVKEDMSQLYDQVRDGTTELKQASELANIAGKYLKAEQLALAREIFVHSRGSRNTLAADLTSRLVQGFKPVGDQRISYVETQTGAVGVSEK